MRINAPTPAQQLGELYGIGQSRSVHKKDITVESFITLHKDGEVLIEYFIGKGDLEELRAPTDTVVEWICEYHYGYAKQFRYYDEDMSASIVSRFDMLEDMESRNQMQKDFLACYLNNK